MDQVQVERRRKRRLSLQAPVQLGRVPARVSTDRPLREEYVTKDLGLGGVYFETAGDSAFAVDEIVTISVAIPETHIRQFPFSRLAGPGRVVRVTPLAGADVAAASKGRGVALAFSSDLTALSALPLRP